MMCTAARAEPFVFDLQRTILIRFSRERPFAFLGSVAAVSAAGMARDRRTARQPSGLARGVAGHTSALRSLGAVSEPRPTNAWPCICLGQIL